MRFCKKYEYGEVVSYELGWAPVGMPMMTVRLYCINGIMIDTGLGHMQKEALEIFRLEKIRKILLTHHHEDHSGNAAAMKRLSNIPVLGHPHTVEKMKKPYKILPFQHYMWKKTEPLEMGIVSETIESGRISLKPVHTPGHSKDHLVYLDPNFGRLFSGDMYLADRIRYCRSDERIGDQIDSLKKIITLDFDALFCSHNPHLKNGKKRIAAKLRFLEDFYGQVGTCMKAGMTEDKEIFKKMGLMEDHFIKWFCFGNISMLNMVRSAIAAFTESRA